MACLPSARRTSRGGGTIWALFVLPFGPLSGQLPFGQTDCQTAKHAARRQLSCHQSELTFGLSIPLIAEHHFSTRKEAPPKVAHSHHSLQSPALSSFPLPQNFLLLFDQKSCKSPPKVLQKSCNRVLHNFSASSSELAAPPRPPRDWTLLLAAPREQPPRCNGGRLRILLGASMHSYSIREIGRPKVARLSKQTDRRTSASHNCPYSIS